MFWTPYPFRSAIYSHRQHLSLHFKCNIFVNISSCNSHLLIFFCYFLFYFFDIYYVVLFAWLALIRLVCCWFSTLFNTHFPSSPCLQFPFCSGIGLHPHWTHLHNKCVRLCDTRLIIAVIIFILVSVICHHCPSIHQYMQCKWKQAMILHSFTIALLVFECKTFFLYVAF